MKSQKVWLASFSTVAEESPLAPSSAWAKAVSMPMTDLVVRVHVEIIDSIDTRERFVQFDHQVGAIEIVAQRNLARDTLQNLRQGLIDRIDADATGNRWIDIEIQARVACKCEQQFAGRQVGRDHGESLQRLDGLGRRDNRRLR